MNNIKQKLIFLALTIFPVEIFAASSPLRDSLNKLFYYTTASLIVGVFLILFYCLLQQRKLAKNKTVLFHKQGIVEVIWTIIPIFILVALALPAFLKGLY